MKRLTLIVAALCLVMIATVGAGAVAAQQENLRQAGSSSIYFYKIAPTDMHGKGKLQIDLDKHTFEFNGKGFEPSAQIVLRARAAGSTNYVVFATGEATPSGNLHIAGTWEAAAAAEEVVADAWYLPVYGFVLTNYGWFVAQLACYYSTDGGVTWHESAHIDGVTRNETVSAYLGELGVPYNAAVKIHVEVVAGKDRTGSDVFQYNYTDYPVVIQHWVKYGIYGTTGNPRLEYEGVFPDW